MKAEDFDKKFDDGQDDIIDDLDLSTARRVNHGKKTLDGIEESDKLNERRREQSDPPSPAKGKRKS